VRFRAATFPKIPKTRSNLLIFNGLPGMGGWGVNPHMSPEIPKKNLNSGLVANGACFFRKPLIFPVFPSISLYFVQAHNSTAKQQHLPRRDGS
jgi:hypothetical protein